MLTRFVFNPSIKNTKETSGNLTHTHAEIAILLDTEHEIKYKQVLLRERKRHTARRVASTPYVVLTGYPPILTWPGGGGGGYPPGYPPSWTWQGTPWWLPHGILGNVAKHYGIWYPPPQWLPHGILGMLQSIMGYGYPPRCEQTNKVKLLPSRRTTYAGGNKQFIVTF